MKLAILFPGQGSQEFGMASDFYQEFKVVRDTFTQADEILAYPISKIILEGPPETLTLTENAQPAILTASYAIWQCVSEFIPDGAICAFAGHSLGEYTALTCSGSLDFSRAVQLVHLRGKFMQEAVPVGGGMMIAVLGLNVETVASVISEFSSERDVVDIANINSPEQIVLSGARTAVGRCIEPLKSAGAKRVIELNVSAPFHSRFMQKCADSLAPYLQETQFKPPSAPIFSNYSAQAYPQDVSLFASHLIKQITAPVMWVDEVMAISKLAPDAYIELGPGRVLRNLVARIIPNAKLKGVSTVNEFKAILPYLTGEEPL